MVINYLPGRGRIIRLRYLTISTGEMTTRCLNTLLPPTRNREISAASLVAIQNAFRALLSREISLTLSELTRRLAGHSAKMKIKLARHLLS